MKLHRALFPLLLALHVSSVGADTVQIAVAANFAAPAQKIASEFERQSEHKAVIATGSTGKFYAQIMNGAPFEVLLAADDETPARLEKEKHAQPGSRYTYAIGKLVLWSPKPDLIDNTEGVLHKAAFRHLSIANPKVAPYGAAAVQTLRSLKLYERVQDRLVTGENIAQTHQFVASGNAELGFVAYSQVLKEGRLEGSVWQVPQALYSPIRQDAVLLSKGRENKAAAAFLEFLKSSPKAREIILSYGYSL